MIKMRLGKSGRNGYTYVQLEAIRFGEQTALRISGGAKIIAMLIEDYEDLITILDNGTSGRNAWITLPYNTLLEMAGLK